MLHGAKLFCGTVLSDESIVAGGDAPQLAVGGVEGASLQHLDGHTDYINDVDAAPDPASSRAHRLLSGSADRTVRMWDIGDQQRQAAVFTGHKGPVRSVCWLGTGCQTFASGGGHDDMSIRVWTVNRGLWWRRSRPSVMRGHTSPVESVHCVQGGGQPLLASA